MQSEKYGRIGRDGYGIDRTDPVEQRCANNCSGLHEPRDDTLCVPQKAESIE